MSACYHLTAEQTLRCAKCCESISRALVAGGNDPVKIEDYERRLAKAEWLLIEPLQ